MEELTGEVEGVHDEMTGINSKIDELKSKIDIAEGPGGGGESTAEARLQR